MASHDHIKLTASELSVLFMTYSEDTLVHCVTSYFLEHVEDPDIRACVQYAWDISVAHVDQNRNLFEAEGLPVPAGFTESDVNIKASRLYSDEVILEYIANLGVTAMSAYSLALAQSARPDIRQHYTSCLESAAELYNRTSTLLQRRLCKVNVQRDNFLPVKPGRESFGGGYGWSGKPDKPSYRGV